MNDQEFDHHAIRTGSIVGALAVLVYVSWSVLPLPYELNRLLHFAFGPLLVGAFLGILFFLNRQRRRFLHYVACAYGVVAGSVFTSMTVVQAAMTDWVHTSVMAETGIDSVVRRYLVAGPNSVQLGLDVAWDIFITLATILVALSLLARPGKAMRVFALIGLLVGSATLALNLWTFPMPPRQSGLIDLGPLVGMWFGGVCVVMAMHTRRSKAA